MVQVFYVKNALLCIVLYACLLQSSVVTMQLLRVQPPYIIICTCRMCFLFRMHLTQQKQEAANLN